MTTIMHAISQSEWVSRLKLLMCTTLFKVHDISVNMDLMSDTRVLPNAPLAGYDEDFSTQSMKTFDLVSLVNSNERQTLNLVVLET